MRYRIIEESPRITQRELYKQNGISELITKVNMSDFKEDPTKYTNKTVNNMLFYNKDNEKLGII